MTLASNWGAAEAERATLLDCDAVFPHPAVRVHRAVDVRAPAPVVFRWLCQLKLAPYSYDLIDNLGRKSPRQLTSGAERLEIGQRFMQIFRLSSFAQDQHITLRSRRAAVTYRVTARGEDTRLLACVLFEPPFGRHGRLLVGNALALGDLVMMRKQLLTLKELSESANAVHPAG